MRIMRGAGARGIAGLCAPSEVVRPFLDVSRDRLVRYGRRRRLVWLEDPTNRSRAHLRNRIRLDLLPALRRADPALDRWLLDIADVAAAWRREVDAFVERSVPYYLGGGGAGLAVAVSGLVGYSRESLAILWPALAGRVGVALDWRGTRRLAEFTIHGRAGSHIQLSGGWQVVRGRDELEMRRWTRDQRPGETRLDGPTVWGQWRFDVVTDAKALGEWAAALPGDRPLRIRQWQAGDTMMAGRAGVPAKGHGKAVDRVERKVKRFLSDAGVHGARRVGWPVVLAGDEIVWIPGIRRTDAAAQRCGTPGPVYACEFGDR
jgi:tRNA(Ile)-lysidine synthase